MIAEIRSDILQLPLDKGGVGLPNLKLKICTAKIMDMKTILLYHLEKNTKNFGKTRKRAVAKQTKI